MSTTPQTSNTAANVREALNDSDLKGKEIQVNDLSKELREALIENDIINKNDKTIDQNTLIDAYDKLVAERQRDRQQGKKSEKSNAKMALWIILALLLIFITLVPGANAVMLKALHSMATEIIPELAKGLNNTMVDVFKELPTLLKDNPELDTLLAGGVLYAQRDKIADAGRKARDTVKGKGSVNNRDPGTTKKTNTNSGPAPSSATPSP